jgi:hypothetical protein
MFVHFPSIKKTTWLLWSKRGRSIYLRDYSGCKEKVVRKLSVAKGQELMQKANDDQVVEMSCFNKIRVDRVVFWHELQKSYDSLSGFIKLGEKEKLQTLFKTQCLPLLESANSSELRAYINVWIKGFSKSTEKPQLSPYDSKKMAQIKKNSGRLWQSEMLNFSRSNKKASYVKTGHSELDFSFALAELTMALSKKDNPFARGFENRIQPDGLGVRVNGFLTVIEVKGTEDEKDLMGPVLQAACGATAIIGKKEMICAALKKGAGLRPPLPKAKIPKRRSIGLHVLTSEKKSKGQRESWSPKIKSQCQTLMKAFEQLEYIAFSFVEPEKTEDFSVIKIDELVRPPEDKGCSLGVCRSSLMFC